MATAHSDPANPFLSIHAIRIFVHDLDRSLRFYVDQLGFSLVVDTRLQSGGRWVAVSPPDSTTMLTLFAPGTHAPEYKLIGRATQIVLVTSDVAAKFSEWSKNGVRFVGTPRLKRITYNRPHEIPPATQSDGHAAQDSPVWGGVFVRFRDIDGNIFSLVSFDEVTHAIESQS